MEISWNQIGQAGWDYLANIARAPLAQRWTYGEVHAALGGTVLRAVIRQNGQEIAICQYVSRRIGNVLNTSLATRGPLWLTPLSDAEKSSVFRLLRKTTPLGFPRVQLFTLPEPKQNARLISLMTPTTIAQLDLDPSTQRARLHGKWRSALKQAEASGLRCRHITCPNAALAHLLQLDIRQQNNNGYRALPAAFIRHWQRVSPDDLRLITVSDAGQTIASALFLHHGNTASYQIAQTTERGRETSAQRLALWRGISDFTDLGVKQIDLGPIDTINTAGLARFKLGTGAKARRLGPTVLAI